MSGRPLDVEGVRVHFGGLRALDDVSLRVERDTIVGLIGPNGAGKTTLFDVVGGILSPGAGTVRLFGTDVTGWPPHRRARLGLGRTFQRLELFGSLSVLSNVIVALEAVSSVGGIAGELLRRPASIDVRHRAQHRAEELLDLVGLSEHAAARAADLPIGLARVCELAQAIATDPLLLLLDEPSSGLNDAETERLAELLRLLRSERGLSMLVVEHDMSFVLPLSDDVYVLDFGQVIAQGPPEAIRRHPAVVAAYLGEEMPDAPAAGR